MITENEQKALQLAKKVFEHFTHDALPIAREIIAMEYEMGQSPIITEQVNGKHNSIHEIEKTDGQPINELLNDFPVSEISIIDPAMPVKHLSEELVYKPEDDFPF